MIVRPSFYRQFVELQRDLAADLESERFPESFIQMVSQLMGVDNVLVVGAEGEELGPWAEKRGTWRVRSYSVDAIRKAIQSETGYHKGGTSEESPSASQIAGNILSCLAARVKVAGRTIACIYCDIRSGTRVFTEEDAACLKLVAESCAVYIAHLAFCRQKAIERDTDALRLPFQLDSMLVGDSSEIRRLKSEILAMAAVNAPVLIVGETGTGKEVVARALHELSPRAGKDFIPVHCAAINVGTFESEMFGHERGAFSGAYQKREGRILQAAGGTLFLDEVSDIPLEFQIKLLRVLEDKRVTPVGSDFELPVDFRLVCATNRDLRSDDKTFREDLYYRISDIQLRIPPLRARLEDVPLLARHFSAPKQLSNEALELLLSIEDWPGNVRQLRKVVENACMFVSGYVVPSEAIAKQLEYQQMLRPPVAAEQLQKQSSRFDFHTLRKRWQEGTMEALELEHILNSLYRQVRNNWRRVGNQLGLNTAEELKAFRNWVYYLQKTSVIRPPRGEG